MSNGLDLNEIFLLSPQNMSKLMGKDKIQFLAISPYLDLWFLRYLIIQSCQY